VSGDPTTIRRLYGRRQGFALRGRQQQLLEEVLPRLSVPADGPLTAARLFGDERPLWLEVGFGKGEHLAAQAAANPHAGLIGCEPFVTGMAGALNRIEEEQLPNVRLHMGDALEVLERLADGSLDRLFLLHPDPWPKNRHAKRRFVNPGPLGLVAAKLRAGGELRIGTDHPVYCRWTLMQMGRRPDFEWLAAGPRDWRERPADWPPTRYEQKARSEGRPVWYLRYRRA
jgi:tRNA (guanine-N7-)-methyltransferase